MNKKEVKKAPALRFKGFTNDWEQRKLGCLMNITSVKRIHQSDWRKKGIPFYRARDITALSKNLNIEEPIFISRDLYEEYSKISGKVQINDLLVTGVGTIGVPLLVQTVPLYFKDGNIIWFQNSNKLIGLFFLYLFKTNTVQKYIHTTTGVGTVPTYTIQSGKNTPVYITSKKEQKDIGTIFQLIDNLISLQQRKLKLLRTLKSGLSFKLFNKKHLNNLSQISLDQIGQTYSGLTGKSKKDFGHGHAFYVSYLNVNQNEIGNPKQIDRIEIDKKQNLVQKNDIFFTISSETPEEVGLTSLWPVSCKNLYLNSFCFGFRINTKMFIPLYLGYLFRSEYFREKVLPLAQGISRYNLSKNNVLKIKIGQEEIAIQEKYAKVMNDLDSDILRQKKKVKELKLCKKFLLQNMFI